MRPPNSGVRILLLALLGLGVGFSLWIHPALPLVLVCLVSGLAIGLLAPERGIRLFLVVLGLLLTGYAFFGRGFAHWGVRPLYVGEVVLVLGLLTVVPSGVYRKAFRSPVIWIWCGFAAWSLVRTVGFVGEYGIDSLRDSVLYGYGLFAVLVSGALLDGGKLRDAFRAYRTLVPWLLVVPVLVLFLSRIVGAIPDFPGGRVPIVEQKPGDVSVFLGGAGVFMLLGLHRDRIRLATGLREWILWSVWLVAFLVAGILSRGGMLAAFLAISVAIALARPRQWLGRALRPAFLVLVAATLFVVSSFEVVLRGDRRLSAEQVITNLSSIGAPTEHDYLSETREWRLAWWGDIVDYTVFGPYFWGGKGYGVNLEESDGYRTLTGVESRSPHNGHMTVLARSGVPGMALWIAFLGAFSLTVLRSYRRLRRGRWDGDAALVLWTWCFWLAFVVNAAFDIYLEGPQGGIWFWSLTGFGIALTLHYRSESAQPLVGGSFSSVWR